MLPALSLFAASCYVVTSAEMSVPPGHLQPLGSHKPPTVTVDEFTTENAPKPEEFFKRYVEHSKAAIFRGAVTGSRAFRLWTDEYIRNNFGDMEVRVEGINEKRSKIPLGEKYLGRDSLRHFVDHYHDPDSTTYIVSDLPDVMYADVGVLPSLGACGTMGRRIVEVDLWWNGGGSSSIIHKDAFNQINCLLNGTKFWKLIENKYEKDIYKHPEDEIQIGGFSDVDPQEVDLVRYPDVAKIEWSNFTLYPGDCLFLPKSYYHQVNSAGTHNIAVSLLFSRFDNTKSSVDFSDCTEATDYKTIRSLADFDVQLIWKGKGMMVMGRTDLEDYVRPMLADTVNELEAEGEIANLTTLLPILEELSIDGGSVIMGDQSEVFRIMDRNDDGVVTSQEIKDLTLNEMRLIGDELSSYEPSNSYLFEYSLISFEDVWWLLQKSLHQVDELDEETWLTRYKSLGGSDQFGREVFYRLSGNKTAVVTKDVTKRDIWFALENWRKYWFPQHSALLERPEESEEEKLWNWIGEVLGENHHRRQEADSVDVGETIIRHHYAREFPNEARSRIDEL